MPTRTNAHQREFTKIKPRENHLYEREGFDRKGLRYEFSNSDDLSLTDFYIEDEGKLRVDQRSVDFGDGPSGLGEGGGAGVSFIVEQGERFPTNRYAYGFALNQEEVDAGANSIEQQRDALMEKLDFDHDARFFMGFERHDGNRAPGVFEWIDNNISSDRILDASTYSYSGVEENLIKYDAYSQISNRLMSVNDPTWGVMVGSQDALGHFNKVQEGSSDRSSYWDRINSNDNAGVGVDSLLWMPDEIQFGKSVEGQDPKSVSLVDGNSNWDGLGSDEVYLFPDMDEVRDKYWRLKEMSEPEPFVNTQNVGRVRYDYVDRFAVDYDPTDEHPNVTDCVKLTNVSQLFA